MAEKKDSQDLCFVSDDNYRDFLLRNAPEIAVPGSIVDRFGNKLGDHQGSSILYNRSAERHSPISIRTFVRSRKKRKGKFACCRFS